MSSYQPPPPANPGPPKKPSGLQGPPTAYVFFSSYQQALNNISTFSPTTNGIEGSAPVVKGGATEAARDKIQYFRPTWDFGVFSQEELSMELSRRYISLIPLIELGRRYIPLINRVVPFTIAYDYDR